MQLKIAKPASPAGRLKIKNCDGTYFQLLDYSAISDKPDMEFAEYLTKEIGVAVIPLSPFSEDRKSRSLDRICFAKSDEVLEKAAEHARTHHGIKKVSKDYLDNWRKHIHAE